MAKIVVNGDEMTVKEYTEMLEGAYRDAEKRLLDGEGEEIASFALPDPCAFDSEVEDALKEGRISERTYKMLYNKAKEQWNAFRMLLAAEGLDATDYQNFR